jgi:sulfur carrier protein ThiS
MDEATIRVTVKLVGGFVHTLGFSEREFELPPGAILADLLAAIGIDPARPMIASREGWVIRADDELHDGDRVMIAPVFSGG